MTNRFGSTAEMVIQTVEENGTLYLLAIDADGLYLTTPDKLDLPGADPNRFASNRKEVAARLSALGLDPERLAADNRHKIPTEAVSTARKVNPLKASKRAMKKSS